MKRQRFDGVRKRCRHDRKDWDLCGCPWFYAATVNKVKHRGKIPAAASLEDARIAFARIVPRLRHGQPAIEPSTSPDSLTVAQLGDDWLSLSRGRKATTIKAYRDNLRAYVNPVLGQKLVATLTPDECEAFMVAVKPARLKRPLSTATKQRIAVTLQALFTYAISKRKRLDNPAADLRALVTDADASPDDDVIDPKDHTKYFTADEARDLLHTVETTKDLAPWYVFVRTGLETGMRMGELAALRYDTINWRGGYLTVKSAWVSGRFTSPKNGRSRTVSLSRELRALLRLRWRQHRNSARLVFTSQADTPIDVRNFRRREWQSILDAADLDYRKPHAMRHTHTSLLLQAGESPVKVAAEAGRSLQETMRTYAHFLPGGNRESAEVLAGLFSGKSATLSKRKIA